ncbi:MAG TPA: methylmalonyl Co-A mutase-associated GTPase MeaB [Acidimicrobiales bacterium]|nr:methylmalonyl Co-A mutase-associated GTPase MeaB [Acidimicrobiales bacterium]
MTEPADLVSRAAAGDRRSISRLVSLVEDGRPAARPRQEEAMAALAAATRRRGGVVGVTGSPGSGKSTLLGGVARAMLAGDPALTLAMVAVDPSSPTSGGALLGDRTRMRPDTSDRLFVRSQASSTSLGGLAPTTYLVTAVLARLFDVVLVETVGIGQSEADVRHLATDVYLVVGPLAGDELQFLKAGIIEVPDAFVVSKWDEPAARRTYHQLRATLWLARPTDHGDIPVHRTSAKDGHGIADLAADVVRRARRQLGTVHVLPAARYFFRRWVAEEWGRFGLRLLDELGGADLLVTGDVGLSAAQARFEAALPVQARRPGG